MSSEQSKITNEFEVKPSNFRIVQATSQDEPFAQIVSQWTMDAGTMLPKTSEDVLELFKNGYSVLVFSDSSELISHAAITYIYTDGSVEIGCVVTDKTKRNKGAGTAAAKAIIDLANSKYPNSTIFALANNSSAPIFEKLGGRKMLSTELSDEVWGPCATCPKLPVQSPNKPFTCCDIPYCLSDLREKGQI